MILVCAGNYREYMDYLKEEELSPLAAHYVDPANPDGVMGLVASEVVVYGTFWNLPRAKELLEIAESRTRQ